MVTITAASRVFIASLALLALAAPSQAQVTNLEPITIGEGFTIHSTILGETRRINVYRPPAWGEDEGASRPVLYMPDGGVAEDFLHVAGLLQVSVGNGSIRPVILVGIENTERRRDLTGPTSVASDSTIAPRVGESAAFRSFIRDELIPLIDNIYHTTDERAIIGESLAGLFVVETLLLQPGMFRDHIAFDPSLWWNAAALTGRASELLKSPANGQRGLYLTTSSEPELARLGAELVAELRRHAPASLTWHYSQMPDETHATIYHPAALAALRTVYKR